MTSAKPSGLYRNIVRGHRAPAADDLGSAPLQAHGVAGALHPSMDGSIGVIPS